MVVKKKVIKRKVAAKKKPVVKKKVVKKKAANKAGKGRPTAYTAKYAGLVRLCCSKGSTDKEIAEAIGVTIRTITRWKKSHPKDFCLPLKQGKAEADKNVINSMYHNACGYSHPDVDIRVINNEIVKTELTKYYPPNPASGIFWLCNRDPENWKRNPMAGGQDEESEPLSINFNINPAVGSIDVTRGKS